MFSALGRFLAKRVLPTVAANLRWKIKQVERRDGFYVWFYVEAFGFTLLDEEVKISNQKTAEIETGEVVRLDQPIDVDFGESADDIMKRLAREGRQEIRKQTEKLQ